MSAEQNEIRQLLEAFDRPEASFRAVATREQASRWIPSTANEREALATLTAEENRESLRAWYASATSLNPHANLLRQVLEDAIGETLPLGNDCE